MNRIFERGLCIDQRKEKSWYIYRSGRWICQRRSRDSGSYGREDGHTGTQNFAYRDGRNGGYVDHNV